MWITVENKTNYPQTGVDIFSMYLQGFALFIHNFCPYYYCY